MIKNLVFDMGNVLIYFDNPEFIRRRGVTNPEEIQMLINEVYGCSEWPLLDWGGITEEEIVTSIQKRVPDKFHDVVRDLVFDWSNPILPVPGMADLIREYKEKGYKIYLLSNAGLSFHRYWPTVPGSDLFDGYILSADVRCIKPMPEIYQALFDKYNLKPEECLFTDDLNVNVAGAIHMGMNGIVYRKDFERFRKELKIALNEK